MDGEQPAKPKAPADLNAPGLIYRLRRRGWVLSWSPRSDLMERGYQGKTVRVWPSDTTPLQQSEPTRAEWEVISAWCVRYHAEQLLWARGGVEDDPKSLFDGTIRSLINIYQKHKKSPFQELRHKSSLTYASGLRALTAAIGQVRVKHITFNDITDWQDQFADMGDGSAPSKGYSGWLISHLKRIVTFGTLVLPKEAGCHDLYDIFAKMAESQLLGGTYRQRTEYMTAAQCRLLRAKAHEMGRPSIALEQALAFELGVRQKDVIGEWIPVSYPGVSDVHEGPHKWMLGFRWDEIDETPILRHRLSKSVRGKGAIMDPRTGKLKAWDLTAYPMVMDELRRLTGKAEFTRADLPMSGPMIVLEESGRPWGDKWFRVKWREIARAAGVPDSIQNRDSRPGAATEADLAGADEDKTRRSLGHSRKKTTEIYLRGDVEIGNQIAKLRVEKRKP